LLPYVQHMRIGTPIGDQVVEELAAIRKQLELLRIHFVSNAD
jgi:hypothetical protein